MRPIRLSQRHQLCLVFLFSNKEELLLILSITIMLLLVTTMEMSTFLIMMISQKDLQLYINPENGVR